MLRSPVNRHRRLRSAHAAPLLLLAAGCGGPTEPAGATASEATVPSFASGGTVQYSVTTLPRLPGSIHAGAFDLNDAGVVVGWSNVGNIGSRHRAVMWRQGVVVDLGLAGGFHQVPGEPDSSFVQSDARGIGPTGVIVGSWRKYGTGPSVPERRGAFRWTLGSGVDSLLGFDTAYALSKRFTEAFALNGQGTVVGYSTTAAMQEHAVRWTAKGAVVDIHPAWASTSRATDINLQGWISGYATIGTQDTVALLWPPKGPPVPLGTAAFPNSLGYGLNDSARVVGAAFNPAPGGVGFYGRFAALWPPFGAGAGTVLYPCGDDQAGVAFEISNLRRLVGWCVLAGSARAWTARAGGSYQILPNPLATASAAVAYAVNGCGTATGYAGVDAVVWTRINPSGPSGAPVCDQ
jgi:probable HAF family extracellular repeat protein